MKLFTVAVSCLALLGGVFAQSLDERLPGCAAECFEAMRPMSGCSLGSNSSEGMKCLCTDASFQNAIAACNAANCTVVEALEATNETMAECGIPIRDNSTTMVAVTAAFGSLAFLMVLMRLVNRGFSQDRQLGWDDFLVSVSGLCSLFQNIPVYVAGHLGFGRDMWGMEPDNITLSLKYLFVTYFTYQLVEMFCQLSILAFYLRLVASATTKILIYVLMGVVVGFGLGNTFSMVLQCRPIPFFWAGWKGEMEGVCTVDVRLFGFIRGGIEITLDLIILTIPLPMLSKLQMSLRKKIQIMSMFCVGFVITIVGCLRLWSLVQFDQSTNPTYDNVSGIYWCVTEANLFIVVACMPAMRPIFQKVVPVIFGSPHQTSGYQNNTSGHGHEHRSGSLPFGVIQKSMDVKVQREDRSESDVELMDRPPYR